MKLNTKKLIQRQTLVKYNRMLPGKKKFTSATLEFVPNPAGIVIDKLTDYEHEHEHEHEHEKLTVQL